MGLLGKKTMNFCYGMGAAVVIVGALFKLMHWPGASLMLIVGLSTEALIFGLSAFDSPDDELDWTLVYPELANGEAKKKETKKVEETKDAQGLLSQKLDNMLKEAKIDGELMSSLGNSIKNFEGAAKNIAPTVDSIASTKKYAEEIDRESAYELLTKKIEDAVQQAEAQAEEENQTEEKKSNEPSTGSVIGKSVVKVVTSATFIRGVFGVLSKLFKR